MNYEQHNSLPLPEGQAFQSIQTTMDTIYDWEYALRRRDLLGLYEKGKAAAWNASDLDWSVEVNMERIMHERQEAGMGGLFNDVLNPPRRLDQRELLDFNMNMNAYMLSQFLHGEQGALLSTAKIVQQVPWEEAKFYAANQVSDEARHVEVYHRYLTEKLGLSYEINPSLKELLDDILGDSRWDITYLGMQIMVEGLALAAFGTIRIMLPGEPLIQDITERVMGDEARHVAFGVLSLEKLYREEMTEAELREREEFVIEGTHLMRERLLMGQIFDRLGWDKKVWVPWMRETPFMRGFRQMLFSKIVPNLKRLGLLTPRVRKAYEQMDLLRFEHNKDSLDEPGVAPPQELIQLLADYMNRNENQAAGAAKSGPVSA